jgi:ATP-dependent helicase/nuclease subunit A
MKLRIVTASAGTGKTTRLAQLLDEAVSARVRPEAILATTFTQQAAAELVNRARTRLLQSNHPREAQALLAARIGTVNAVCGGLVSDFSFELGLSPRLRVLDEVTAELELKRALDSVVSSELNSELFSYRYRFDQDFDWQLEVRRLIEAARANGLASPADFAESAERSVASLDECLGPVDAATDHDLVLQAAIDAALRQLPEGPEVTDVTARYRELLVKSGRALERKRLPWGEWAKLCTREPGRKQAAQAVAVTAAARAHSRHPRLRAELAKLIRQLFEVAASGLAAYAALKQEQGFIDFVDQEVLALRLLELPAVRAALEGELELVLVDEFQDTSPLQLAIFLRLGELARESVWVGDPKQAIYGFRGADPALMDRAIESLSNPGGELVARAVAAAHAPVETLSVSYRSRPELVQVTNALFAPAFERVQGLRPERVAVEAKRAPQPELGPPLQCWSLQHEARPSGEKLAGALAGAVSRMLASPPAIADRQRGGTRPATGGDVAVLCRTNKQCELVAEALAQLGIPAVLARVKLLETAEARVAVAGLQLWVDPRDRLAAAELVRALEFPDDPAGFLALTFGEDRLLQSAPVQAVARAREALPDRGVTAALEAVIDALELRRWCAAWGDGVQRTANLDALRAHAASYCAERRAGRDPASLVGFLAYLADLVSTSGWGTTRLDTQARVGSDDAVTLSTWHAAKGLEWPVVVLFGLEELREPAAYGVHVLNERAVFNLDDPLGGRRLHFWPNPYTTSNMRGPVKDCYGASAAHAQVSEAARREALRVAYVGWTRARDLLVLAARDGKLLGGLLAPLGEIPGLTPVEQEAAEPRARAVGQGELRVGRARVELPLASLSPSEAPQRPGLLGAPVRLGAPLKLRGEVAADALGSALHAFFAAERGLAGPSRLELARGLLDRYGVAAALEPAELLELGDRLWRWVRAQFGDAAVVHTEWPLAQRLSTGGLVAGTADLIIEGAGGVAVIDHKSYGLPSAAAQANALAGQLGCYADVLAQARGVREVSRWVHLPFEGVVVPLNASPLPDARSA